MSCCKESYLSDLMPYDPSQKNKASLKISLIEYRMLLRTLLESIRFFETRDLHKFDALVGENACQIRALWIALIASKNLINTSRLIEEVTRIKNEIDSLLNDKIISKLMNSKISLLDLLCSKNLLIAINLEESIILKCFLLTETKILISEINLSYPYSTKEKYDPKKLKKFGDISSSFAGKLVSRMRKLLAIASVQFVRENISKIQNEHLIKMLSDEYAVKHNDYLLCTPMFWTYKSVLITAKREQIPIIIHTKFLDANLANKIIDEDWIFFEPVAETNTSINQQFVAKSVLGNDYKKEAVVIEGISLVEKNKSFSKSQWRKNFLNYSIDSIILSGAAEHRQYPNQEKDLEIQSLQDHEYETYKSFAESEGFSLNNPTNFFILHVYPSKLDNFISCLKDTHLNLAVAI